MKIDISRIIKIILFLYVSFCVFIFFYQKNLIFFPTKDTLLYPTYQNLEEINIKTEDGLSLNAWYMDNKSDKTIIFFHWNGWNIYYNQKRLKIFKELNLNAIMFDYRGYWKSEWEIKKEEDLYNDADAVYKYIINKWVNPGQIILWWQSLGSGIAIDTAQNKEVYAVISEATFYSMETMAKKLYSYLPIKLLLRFHFRNYEKIKNINSPILLIHSKSDEMVDIENAKKLFELIAWKKYFLETMGSHDWAYLDSYDLYVSTLKKFLKGQ